MKKVYADNIALAYELLQFFHSFIERKRAPKTGRMSMEDFHYSEKIQELKFVGPSLTRWPISVASASA